MMEEEDTSNDVEAVEYIDSQDEEDNNGEEKRPIMLLLRRLIRNKQNTVMTNAQIVDILQSEFNINVAMSHELEVDIYIKIIKKYLKDWPQWEELERISTKLTNLKDFDAISKVLNHKYKNLKEYLGVMLEAAKPLAKDAVAKVTAETSKPIKDDTGEVVMEVQCTRKQLKHLFFRRPNLELNNTVFNMFTVPPKHITVNQPLTFEEILDVWWIQISITLPHFVFKRHLFHVLKHVLVNKVISKDNQAPEILDTNPKMLMDAKVRSQKFDKEIVIQKLNSILEECRKQCSDDLYEIKKTIFKMLTTELYEFTDDAYNVPGHYKRIANKYKYVRYLYAENEKNNDPGYDLQLEETVTPVYMYEFSKLDLHNHGLQPGGKWLELLCCMCKMQFEVSAQLKEKLLAHYAEEHMDELDWQCQHCKRVFGLDFLAKNKWCHEC